MTTAMHSKNRRKLFFLFATFTLGVVFGLTVMLTGPLGPLALPIAMVCAIGGFVCSLGYFANMDELSQRAHYIAWFWGATTGLGVLALGLFYTMSAGINWGDLVAPLAERYWGGADVRGGFAAGVSIVVLLQFAGAMLWWAGYWLRKR
jgi:hypothetical protein